MPGRPLEAARIRRIDKDSDSLPVNCRIIAAAAEMSTDRVFILSSSPEQRARKTLRGNARRARGQRARGTHRTAPLYPPLSQRFGRRWPRAMTFSSSASRSSSWPSPTWRCGRRCRSSSNARARRSCGSSAPGARRPLPPECLSRARATAAARRSQVPDGDLERGRERLRRLLPVQHGLERVRALFPPRRDGARPVPGDFLRARPASRRLPRTFPLSERSRL